MAMAANTGIARPRSSASRSSAPDDDRLLGLAGALRGRQTGHRRPPCRWPDALPGPSRHDRRGCPSLYRVLRALASVGVFTESGPDTFALTPLADLLRSGTPGSMRALALMYAEEQYRAWGDLLHSVQTGTTAFPHQFGTDYFAYLAGHPEADRVFNAAMTGWTGRLAEAVADAYDFSPFGTVVDVGG